MSRVEPNRNVYVGHRYVPLLVGEWDKSIQYEGLSIVTFKGASYTSKKMTPPGIDIENEEYWLLTGNYDAQVEKYRQDVINAEKNINDGFLEFKNTINNDFTTFENDINDGFLKFKDNINDDFTTLENGIKEDTEEFKEMAKSLAITPLMFGAVGDGVTVDTEAVQETIYYCEDNGYIFHSTPSYTYLTDEIVINEEIELTGTINLKANTDNQESVLRINNKIDSKATINIYCEFKAKNGILADNFGRSSFYRTNVERSKIWGFMYLDKNNNNFVTHDFYRGYLNGYREDITINKISSTDNVESSTLGYGTYEFDKDIDEIYKEKNTTYFLLYDGEPYKINNIDGKRMDVANLNAGNIGESITVTLISGGALNISKYGDNGVGSFNGIDAISNNGVGVHIASLYGHKFNNLVAQGNAIGICSNDYSLGVSLNAPYFELNRMNIVVWNYFTGTMTHGTYARGTKFRTLVGRVLGNYNGISDLKIISDDVGTLVSEERKPFSNTSGPVEINPGFVTNWYNSTSKDWEIIINNDKKYDGYKTYTSILNLSHANNVVSKKLFIRLKNDNGQTIQKEIEYEHPHKITGNTTVVIFKANNEWKVNVFSENIYTNVTAPPVHVGQIAVAYGVPYISVGTETRDDWKEINTVSPTT